VRILWARTERLLPVNSGGRIRSVQTIRELQRRHQVVVFNGYLAQQPDPDYERLLIEQFPGSVAERIAWRRYQGIAGRLRRQLSIESVTAGDGYSPVIARGIEEAFRARAFDVAVCDFHEPSKNFPRALGVPTVLFAHNVEWARKRDEARRADSLAGRADYWLESVRLKRTETSLLKRFHHTIAVSEDDERAFRSMAPSASVSVVGTGVDTEEFRPTPMPNLDSPLVVYTGLMGYVPNIDAVTWFCREIWPTVLGEVPEARFRIVGRNPAPSVKALESESVEVTGEVDSVVPHLQEASVVVVPLRGGSGTRIKIYEAMASGRPVVSTSLGAVGLDVTHGKDILLADSAEAMGAEVVRTLQHRAHAESLSRAAAATGAAHSWAAVGRQFEAILEQVVAEAGRAHG